jgi:transcription elongation factor Elf1
MSEATNANQQGSSSPGFPCPRCGAPIRVDVRTLLQKAAIYCPSCRLELQIDAEQSEAGLQALRRLNEQMEDAQKTLNQIKQTRRS